MNSILEKIKSPNFEIWTNKEGDFLLKAIFFPDFIYIFEDKGTSFHETDNLYSLSFVVEEVSKIVTQIFEKDLCLPEEKEFSFVDNEAYCNGEKIGLKKVSEDQWEAYPLTVEGVCLINIFLNSLLEKEKANRPGNRTGLEIVTDPEPEENIPAGLLED